MERADALIVGGGPAGSTLAWRLGRVGLDVTVIDARDFPRDKVCAGWITPQVLNALELDVDDYGRGRVLQQTPVVQEHHVRCKTPCLRNIVCGHQDLGPRGAHGMNHFFDVTHGGRIEVRRGFVEQQHRRPEHAGARDRKPLLLTARQRACRM